MITAASRLLPPLTTLAAVIALPSLLFAQGPQPQPAGDAAAGRRFAEERCASCHAIGAGGASPKTAAPAFRDLSRAYPVESLGEAFAEGIVVAHPEMPQFELTEPQIKDLLAYLESVQTWESPPKR